MRKRSVLRILGSLVLLLALVYFFTNVVVCWDVAYVCENTASLYGYRQWPTGQRTRPWAKVSALESFVQAHWPGVIKHRWSRCARTGKTVLGQAISHEDGPLGGAVHLGPAILEKWIATHSERDVRSLYDFLSKANFEASEQRAEEIIREVRKD